MLSMYVIFSNLGIASGNGITSTTYISLVVVTLLSIAFILICEKFDKKTDIIEQEEVIQEKIIQVYVADLDE